MAVAFVLKGYPRLSETFIAQEILALEQRGLDIRIVSLRPPRDETTHPIHKEIQAPVHYLPERLRDEPGRVWGALRAQVRGGVFWPTFRRWLKDFRRDPSLDRIRRFGQAIVLAHELPRQVTHLHAHFLHTPASVTRDAAHLTKLRWSCSAHARDIWTLGDWEKREKLRDMQWLVTCTAAGCEHLKGLAADPRRVELIYHGIDFSRLPAPPEERPRRNGQDPANPVVLLSVGRAVEKKGFDLLLNALAEIPAPLHWRWVHVGGGEMLDELKAQADKLNLTPRIEWLGPRTRDEVVEHYRAADLFVLPCRIGSDGDRDGLPNVLMEAQSLGLACLSTTVSGIPELIEHRHTGHLVKPEDTMALARAIAQLINDPALRRQYGKAGLQRVEDKFSHEPGIDRLASRFGLKIQSDAKTLTSAA